MSDKKTVKKSLLESVSPTTAALLDPDMHFFPCAYTWFDKQFGELSARTVIIGADAEAALKSFQSKNRHLLKAWIVGGAA